MRIMDFLKKMGFFPVFKYLCEETMRIFLKKWVILRERELPLFCDKVVFKHDFLPLNNTGR